jgi:hypothetical protein
LEESIVRQHYGSVFEDETEPPAEWAQGGMTHAPASLPDTADDSAEQRRTSLRTK